MRRWLGLVMPEYDYRIEGDVPGWLEGAWRRMGLSVVDQPFVERSDVLWLQVGPYFADLRVPYTPDDPGTTDMDIAQAFSGWVSFEEPWATWHHDLDTLGRPADHADTAVLEGHGEILFERGEGYVER